VVQLARPKGLTNPSQQIAADVAIDMKNLLKEIDTVTCTLVLLPFQIEANKHADRVTERVGFATAMDFVIARRRNSNDGVTGLGASLQMFITDPEVLSARAVITFK
jgi:hypothetical protein